MEASIRLGKIWGIPVGLHTSWFLVFALVTWSLAVGYFPGEYPALPKAAFWVLGAVTSLLFFGSVLVHELVHSFVALRHKIPVHGVTLFIFGGVAQIGREPSDAGTEFRIALAGPLASLGLAAGFAILWWFGRAVPHLAAPARWLMRINAMLALFNLIPGFPLDGGRVLRAALWHFIGSFQRATQIATFTGQLFAFGFIGLGVLVILGGNFINGLWLVFIGWFLQNAAAVTYAQAALQKSLRDITVAQAMTRDCQLIPPQMPLSQLIEEYVLTGGQRCFFVTEQERLRGLLTLTDMAKIPKGEWAQITAGQIMIPWDRIVRVRPDMALLAALQAMDDANVNQVPVLVGEELVGMLSREQVLRYIRTRSELGI